MRLHLRPVVYSLSLLVGILSFSGFSLAQQQEDPATIVRKSAEANDRDWEAVPKYDNYERDRTKDGDKTFAVTMLDGSPYERVVAINGRKLTGDKEKEEQKKYEKAVNDRQHESAEERSKRIAKYEAERKRDHTMLQQMTTAFDFHMVGKKHLLGHNVYVLKATPRKGYKPPDRDSEVLTGMEGTLWIDQKTYQWVKVEAHVVHPVRIEGFLAEVEPGTMFEVEKRPVAGDIWMASHYSMKSNAKIMFVISHKGEEDDTYFNYHKANNGSETTSAKKN
jgi:hypothetical protein